MRGVRRIDDGHRPEGREEKEGKEERDTQIDVRMIREVRASRDCPVRDYPVRDCIVQLMKYRATAVTHMIVLFSA